MSSFRTASHDSSNVLISKSKSSFCSEVSLDIQADLSNFTLVFADSGDVGGIWPELSGSLNIDATGTSGFLFTFIVVASFIILDGSSIENDSTSLFILGLVKVMLSTSLPVVFGVPKNEVMLPSCFTFFEPGVEISTAFLFNDEAPLGDVFPGLLLNILNLL